jgi:hypothetical protein
MVTTKAEEAPMTRGLQQQEPSQGFCVPKPAAMPQHGQKADKQAKPAREPRSFEPRPGH